MPVPVDTPPPRQARIARTQEKGFITWVQFHAENSSAWARARSPRAPRLNRFCWNPRFWPPASDRKIRFVSIGTGIRGCDLLRSARKLPNGECVGTADLYDMHRKAGVEAYGSDVPTTRDYRELLDRKDVDAVIVAVADFQHRRVVLDCMAAGKDVYCEKPMSHNVADGLGDGESGAGGQTHLPGRQPAREQHRVQESGGDLQVGPARRGHLIEATRIAISDPARGSIPVAPDASPETIDWKTWLRDAPDRPFDAERFFRWRCFADYGEGLAGDLFVHLLSGIQCVTGINAIPARAYSTGSLTHFKDGRDYPGSAGRRSTIIPASAVNMHCNQNNAAARHHFLR